MEPDLIIPNSSKGTTTRVRVPRRAPPWLPTGQVSIRTQVSLSQLGPGPSVDFQERTGGSSGEHSSDRVTSNAGFKRARVRNSVAGVKQKLEFRIRAHHQAYGICLALGSLAR